MGWDRIHGMGWDGMDLQQVGVSRAAQPAVLGCAPRWVLGAFPVLHGCVWSTSVVKDTESIWQDFNPKLEASVNSQGEDLLAGSRAIPQRSAGARGGDKPRHSGDIPGSSRAASGASRPAAGLLLPGALPELYSILSLLHSPCLLPPPPLPSLPPCLPDPQQSLDTLGEGWEV